MAITDDIVKTLKDPTPLYAVAGTADLAAEKLQQVPALIDKIRAEAPERIERIRNTDPKAVQAKAQAKANEVLGTIDLDLKKFRDTAQDVALQSVGRVAEIAVKAREQYDVLAERGKGAVATWRGEAAEHVEDIAVAIEGSPAPAPESAPEGAAASEEAPAKKSSARRATAKKPADTPAG